MFEIPNVLLKLDEVCGVPVCVVPIFDALTKSTPKSTTVHLRVATITGEFFTQKMLTPMCIDPSDIQELLELCKRRIDTISHTYLPKSSRCTSFEHHECFIDITGGVHVTFLVRKYHERLSYPRIVQ